MILALSGIGLGLTRQISPAFDFSCYKSMFGFGGKVFVTVDFVESRLRAKTVSIITTTTESGISNHSNSARYGSYS